MEQLIGQSLDRYQIIALLGEGGMGAVYKAHDPNLDRDVAIKVMHPHFARRRDFQERFLQEARMAARINHPGVVQVHDFGQARSHLYIVMEFISGDNLRKLLGVMKANGKWIVLPEAIQLVRQVCLTLDFTHRQGILHRDIKPDNIMFRPEPVDGLPYRPVLTDLGLAKLLEGGLTTQAGISLGTPAYMSPEQALGQAVDMRSDVYSLGILLYELTAGRLPFHVKTITEAIRCHTKEPPPPPRSIRPDLPESLESVILRALEKDAADRYAGANGMAVALADLLPTAEEITGAPSGMTSAVSLITDADSEPPDRGTSILDEFPTPTELGQDRISVRTPDGTIDAVLIERGQLTIGRSRQNDLVLEQPKVSRQHARIEFDGARYRVIDLNSTNGTFLGDERLTPGAAALWPPDKAVRIGDVWLHLEQADEPLAPTVIPVEATAVGVTQIPSEPATASRVGVFLKTMELPVVPGASTILEVIVLNQGNAADSFAVAVEDIPAAWVSALPPPVRLSPGTQQGVAVVIRPPRAPESRSGDHPLTVRVSSQESPDQSATARATLRIAPFQDCDLDLRPQKVSGTADGTFHLHVSNRGNAKLTVQFEVSDLQGACQFDFETPQIEVTAGQERSVRLRVQPRGYLPPEVGRTFSHAFTVVARAADGAELVRQVGGVWEQIAPVAEGVSLPKPPPVATGAVIEAAAQRPAAEQRTGGAFLLTSAGWAAACAVSVAVFSTPFVIDTIVMWAERLGIGWQLIDTLPFAVSGLGRGAIGGLLTGIALRMAVPTLRWIRVLWVTLGWVVVWTIISFSVPFLGVPPVLEGFHGILFWGIAGAIVGAAGGWVTGAATRQAEPAVSAPTMAISWALAWTLGEVIVEWLARQGTVWDAYFSLGMAEYVGEGPMFVGLGLLLGLIAGAIGAGLTLRQIARARESLNDGK